MGILKRTKKQEKKGPTRQNAVLKVVHPLGYTEVFREPITAGEIMKRYPRHCIARPDVFEYPWIVVRPESVLVPGKVFYLVPHHTLDNLMKSKRHQLEKEQQQKRSQSYCNGTHEDLYKESFYELWNEMRRNIPDQSHDRDKGDDMMDSGPLDGVRPHVMSPERVELLNVKPCLRKGDSVRKKLKLKVSFAPPVFISRSRSGLPQRLMG